MSPCQSRKRRGAAEGEYVVYDAEIPRRNVPPREIPKPKIQIPGKVSNSKSKIQKEAPAHDPNLDPDLSLDLTIWDRGIKQERSLRERNPKVQTIPKLQFQN
jgi:hypothetical protein